MLHRDIKSSNKNYDNLVELLSTLYVHPQVNAACASTGQRCMCIHRSTLYVHPQVISLTETKIKRPSSCKHPLVNISLLRYNFMRVNSF